MGRGLWLAVGLGLGLGVVGYFVGKAGAPPAAISCVANASLIYDVGTGKMTVAPKPYLALRPDTNPQMRAVCFTLVVQGGTAEFDKLEVDPHQPAGQHGKPILVGDLKFGPNDTVVWARYEDEPVWSKVVVNGKQVEQVQFGFDVVAKLKGSTQTIPVDPDMIIRRDY
jgi:hypothetical protein